MKVGRYNYPAQFPDGIDPLMAELRDMILAGQYVLTAEVADFERAFAEFHAASHVRGVNTGTDALAITLAALGVGSGDEVILQANTFAATALAVVMVGARPVLVDADEHSFLINGEQVDAAITARTKAIIPVHLYGKPTPMEPLLATAARHGVFVIEDAAQAHGARWNGQRVGTFGVAGCFSFHPSKNLAAAADGGAIMTNDGSLARAVEEIRSLGQRGQNNHVRQGCNSKLSSLQARILLAKLPHLETWNSDRRRVASSYRNRLADLPVSFQSLSESEDHVYHLFQIRTPERDALLAHLVASGVDAVVRYPSAIHQQPAFAHFGWRSGEFPVAESLSRELVALPIRPDLTEQEIDYVSAEVRRFFETR